MFKASECGKFIFQSFVYLQIQQIDKPNEK